MVILFFIVDIIFSLVVSTFYFLIAFVGIVLFPSGFIQVLCL